MTISEKLTKIAENVPKVYEAGQKSMVDESKIIEKTVSGSVIALDDVSEVPHEVSVQLSSDAITDFSGVEVTVIGENLFDAKKYPLIVGREIWATSGSMTYGNLVVCGTEAFIPCNLLRGKTITILHTTSIGANRGVAFYDDDKTYISGVKNNSGSKITATIPDNASYYRFCMDVTYIDVAQIYETNNEKTYTTSADGTLTIKSASPNMYITAKMDGINITATYHKSWGMQTEHDRFWDAYQANGTRTDYQRCFSGLAWTAETLRPKYDIRPTYGGGTSMFQYCGFSGSLKQHFENLGIKLDFSKLTGLTQPFYQAVYITEMPDIDISGCVNNCTYLFWGCTALKSAKIKTSEAVNIATNSFTNCTALEELSFEGVIGNSLDIHWSTKLSAESYYNIIFHLSSTATGVKLTVPTNAPTVYDAKYGSGAWKRDTDDNINIKGWSFAYA